MVPFPDKYGTSTDKIYCKMHNILVHLRQILDIEARMVLEWTKQPNWDRLDDFTLE